MVGNGLGTPHAQRSEQISFFLLPSETWAILFLFGASPHSKSFLTLSHPHIYSRFQSYLTLYLMCKNTRVGSHSLLRGPPGPGMEPESPALQADALPAGPAEKPVTRALLFVKAGKTKVKYSLGAVGLLWHHLQGWKSQFHIRALSQNEDYFWQCFNMGCFNI